MRIEWLHRGDGGGRAWRRGDGPGRESGRARAAAGFLGAGPADPHPPCLSGGPLLCRLLTGEVDMQVEISNPWRYADIHGRMP